MKKLFGYIAVISFMAMLGVVGGLETDAIHLGFAAMILVVCIVVFGFSVMTSIKIAPNDDGASNEGDVNTNHIYDSTYGKRCQGGNEKW